MKAKELINKLQKLVDEYWNITVLKRTDDWDIYNEMDNDIWEIKTEDNSYDKRFKQETTIIIN